MWNGKRKEGKSEVRTKDKKLTSDNQTVGQ